MLRKQSEKRTRPTAGVVADGYRRGYSAAEPEIRAQVTAEFSGRLQHVSFFKRVWLRRIIEREIKRRIHEKLPPDALF